MCNVESIAKSLALTQRQYDSDTYRAHGAGFVDPQSFNGVCGVSSSPLDLVSSRCFVITDVIDELLTAAP